MEGTEQHSESAALHCPHCGVALPGLQDGNSAPSFCPACGRRVEGWRTGFRASIGGARAGATAPDGEQPTRALAPSAALLRAAIAAEPSPSGSGAGPASLRTDRVEPIAEHVRQHDAREKKKGTSLALLVAMVAGGAALAIGALSLLGKPHRPRPAPIAINAPPIPVAPPAAPVVSVPPPAPINLPLEPALPVKPAVATTAQVATKETTKSPAKIAVKTAVVAPPKLAKGALPHKLVGKTDSKQVDTSSQPSGTGTPPPLVASTAPSSTPPPLVGADHEAAPQTPAQLAESRREQGSAQADAASVRFVVQQHLPQVQACYSRAFKDSAPGGRVDIGFAIGESGRASKVRTESNTTHAPILSSCIEHLISEWQFARPASGEFELIYPFVFSPGT